MSKDVLRPIIGIESRTAQEVFDIMCDRFRSAQSLRSKPVAGVEVKPLEWELDGGQWEFNSYPNPYLIGRQSGDGRFWVHHRIVGDLRGSNGKIALHGTADEAKTAAEDDYRQRILSALVLPTHKPLQEEG